MGSMSGDFDHRKVSVFNLIM